MSWSVQAVGKPAAVAAKVATDLARYKCNEPEETIKNNVGAIIAASLAAFRPNQAVRVEASGSQSTDAGVVISNSVNLKVEPLYGFVE